MRNVLYDLLTVAGVLASVVLVVMLLAPMINHSERAYDREKREFHVTCVSAGGTPAWSGRQWVCIK